MKKYILVGLVCLLLGFLLYPFTINVKTIITYHLTKTELTKEDKRAVHTPTATVLSYIDAISEKNKTKIEYIESDRLKKDNEPTLDIRDVKLRDFKVMEQEDRHALIALDYEAVSGTSLERQSDHLYFDLIYQNNRWYMDSYGRS